MNDNPTQLPPEPVRFRLTEPVQCFLGANLALSLLAIATWVGVGHVRSDRVDFDSIKPIAQDFQVDLNAASWPELAQLPGIGRTLGNRIVTHRNKQGGYTSVEQLIDVKGIGPRVLGRIRPFLVISKSRSQ